MPMLVDEVSLVCWIQGVGNVEDVPHPILDHVIPKHILEGLDIDAGVTFLGVDTIKLLALEGSACLLGEALFLDSSRPELLNMDRASDALP